MHELREQVVQAKEESERFRTGMEQLMSENESLNRRLEDLKGGAPMPVPAGEGPMSADNAVLLEGTGVSLPKDTASQAQTGEV